MFSTRTYGVFRSATSCIRVASVSLFSVCVCARASVQRLHGENRATWTHVCVCRKIVYTLEIYHISAAGSSAADDSIADDGGFCVKCRLILLLEIWFDARHVIESRLALQCGGVRVTRNTHRIDRYAIAATIKMEAIEMTACWDLGPKMR